MILYGQKTATDESDNLKATIRKFILVFNYTIAVVICLILLAQTQLPIVERAIYGFATIFLGMGIRHVVKTLLPLDQDNLGKTL